MRSQSIFLLFYSIQWSLVGGSAFSSGLEKLDPFAFNIRAAILDSKTLFFPSSNDSSDAQLVLKSFQPSVKAIGMTYYLIPESISWAAYDHPESIDLSNYNKSCLKSWAKQYNSSIANCLTSFKDQSLASELFCKAMNRKDDDECERRTRVGWTCQRTVNDLGSRMDEIVFPDGRSLEYLAWNCPSSSICSNHGCSPVFTILPFTTTTSPLQSARDILSVLLKVCIISSVVCALLSFFIRYYAYLHKRTQIQSSFNAPPTPPKSPYTSFPPPSIPYPQMDQYHPSSEPPPPYVAPPPYSERPVEPLPKVA